MIPTQLRLVPRRTRWYQGESIVIDLVLDNGGPGALTVPHPMRVGATAPQYTLTHPDGTRDTFCRADEAPGPASRLTLDAQQRWEGELVVTPSRTPTPGTYTLDATLPLDNGPLDAETTSFDVVPRRFVSLQVCLALGPGGEVQREALLVNEARGTHAVLACTLRESNPRLGEGAAGPLVPRGPLPPATTQVCATSARHDLGLDPQRWLVAATALGPHLRSNLHATPLDLAWPGAHGYVWAALQGPAGAVYALAHWGDAAGAFVGLFRATAAAHTIAPGAVAAIAPMPPGLVSLAGALTPPSPLGAALWAVVVRDTSAGDALETTVHAWRVDLSTGATVEAFCERIEGVRPLEVGAAWSEGPEHVRGAFVGVDRSDGLEVHTLSWSTATTPALVHTRSTLGMWGRDLLQHGLTFWRREGVDDLLVWTRDRTGAVQLATSEEPLRPVRVDIDPASPVAFVPGVDRWYAVHLLADHDVAVDPA